MKLFFFIARMCSVQVSGGPKSYAGVATCPELTHTDRETGAGFLGKLRHDLNAELAFSFLFPIA